ncbi:AIPR family protein [Sphingomonas sp. LB-2]|uniref:AIPR family protein n=1 Tax=Sphingomonas caeni TaxID=2984949 RepID=UPI002232A253|nr:AIPR family protein [Sphingomonas caeni]MCW3847945.1 AIPR family protein [Sphingomonas caeni]
MKQEDLDYKNVLALASKHIAKGRPESAAFLNWFLEEIYNLDDVDADDSICDGNYDQGIDAIYVNEIDQEIVFFQSKLTQNPGKTLGDVALKEFAGSLGQFDSAEKAAAILANTKNTELKKLLDRSKVVENLSAGYKTKGIFVTNALRDENAVAFIGNHPSIALYDRQRIAEDFIDITAPEGVAGSFALSVFDGLMLIYEAGADATMYQFIAPASDLVALSGISDHTLFAQNVRLPLGNTSVNRGIRQSLQDKDSHAQFPLFHNGITLLCANASISDDGETLTITNYVVVNGAQTVTTLYKDRDKISINLRLPIRVIELKKPELAKTITQISNNQNSIKSRDLKENHQIQSRIKSDFEKRYKDEFDYIIKRGESSTAKVAISNEEAGALLLAFDLQRPWSCHQLYRLFEDDYGDVFGRPEVNADRILFVWTLSQIVVSKLPMIKNLALGRYRLTRFFLLYVLSRLMQSDGVGAEIFQNPSKAMPAAGWGDRLGVALDPILSSIIIDLNYEVERAGDSFDYKSELKSPNRVRDRADELLKSYEKEVAKDKLSDFGTRWLQAGEAQ